MSHDRRPSFGFDAPSVPIGLGAASAVFVVLGIVLASIGLVIVGVLFAIELGIFLHTTLRGKFVVWERLLDGLALRGDESIVDLGCGRGAVLIAVAERLDSGTAHGVDI